MSARRAALIFTFVAATLALAWAGFLNGQAFFFPDTSAYLRGADAGMARFFGVTSEWTPAVIGNGASNDEMDRQPATGVHATAPVSETDGGQKPTVILGRSPYYGGLLYLGHVTGGFWLTVIVHAALVALSVLLTLRLFFDDALPRASIVLLVLAIATPVSFFVSLLIPDILAGIGILAGSVLIVLGHRLRRWELIVWFLLLAFAVVSHPSHLLTAIGLGGVGMLWWIAHSRRLTNLTGIAVVFAAVLLAFGAQKALSIGVERTVGIEPLRPPFLTIRALADGTGYEYLRATCPQNGLTICRFADRFDKGLSWGKLLWSKDPDVGIFMGQNEATRRALSAEQYKFYLAAFIYDPRRQIMRWLKNWWVQLKNYHITIANYQNFQKTGYAKTIPASYYEDMRESEAFEGTWPSNTYNRLIDTGLATALVAIVVLLALSFSGRSRRLDALLLTLAVFIILGILGNAAITGNFSGTAHRYNARVIWLIPFIALMFDFDVRGNWWRRVLRSGEARKKD